MVLSPGVIRPAVVLLALTALAAAPAPVTHQLPSTDAQLSFLKNARIVSSRPIGKGVTGALRLTLSDGTFTHDAAFQAVDQASSQSDIRQGRKRAGELMFVDSYRYNIAAWEIARLLALDHMMPATVARRHNGSMGALSWWVDNVLMDEEERQRTSSNPPPGQQLALARQRQLMLIFAELVRDMDRNKGNVLYTQDWRLIMLDFTRAFRIQTQLRSPDNLLGIDRALFARLRALTAQELANAVGDHLTKPELSALMQRRDLIVEHYDKLVKQRGEAAVIFE
jgi:hypothetical protein